MNSLRPPAKAQIQAQTVVNRNCSVRRTASVLLSLSARGVLIAAALYLIAQPTRALATTPLAPRTASASSLVVQISQSPRTAPKPVTAAAIRAYWLKLVKSGETNLRGADLRSANLAGADLRMVNLIGANLQYADLSGADLSLADLRGATFRGANLTDADLRGADLRGADLSVTKLNGANLMEAALNNADVISADLSGADLTHADLKGADLKGSNLNGVKGAYLKDVKRA